MYALRSIAAYSAWRTRLSASGPTELLTEIWTLPEDAPLTTENAASFWNAAFIATGWADFGWWGVVLESLFVGSLIQVIHHWFVTSKKSGAMVGVYAGLIMAATRLSEVSLFSSLWSYGLGSSLLLFLLIKRPLSSRAQPATSPHESKGTLA